jgi:hypothetical protein
LLASMAKLKRMQTLAKWIIRILLKFFIPMIRDSNSVPRCWSCQKSKYSKTTKWKPICRRAQITCSWTRIFTASGWQSMVQRKMSSSDLVLLTTVERQRWNFS